MSDNGEVNSEVRLVFKVEMNAKAGLKVTFGEGLSFEVVSLAVRLASLELDNRIIAQTMKKQQSPVINTTEQKVIVPKSILDKLRNNGIKLN